MNLRVLANVICKSVPRNFNSSRTILKSGVASSSISAIQDPIVESDDGSYFICWHPEKPYPYEHTKPLPPEKDEDKFVLKNMKVSSKVYEKEKHPRTVADELAKITYTTKHRWFPRSRDRYAKKTKADREYL